MQILLIDFFSTIDLYTTYFSFEIFFLLNTFIEDFFFKIFNTIDPFLQNGVVINLFNNVYNFPQNLSFFFGLKFCLSIGFLILIRGGTPRYRYDYLTKLGWLKFLGLIIFLFLISTIFFFLF